MAQVRSRSHIAPLHHARSAPKTGLIQAHDTAVLRAKGKTQPLTSDWTAEKRLQAEAIASSLARSDNGQGGLFSDEVAYLQGALLGKGTASVLGSSDTLLDRIAAQANSGKPVTAVVNNAKGGHYITITAVKDGKLTFIDPADGSSHTVPASAFKNALKAAA